LENSLRDSLLKARLTCGVVVHDLPVFVSSLSFGDWRGIRNRGERLLTAPDSSGQRCDWLWTSDLHAPKIFPILGQLLLRRACRDHPIVLDGTDPGEGSDRPQISFIIGHRGAARIPHLLTTLRSISAQRGIRFECIVIEQDIESRIAHLLPSWVRLVQTPPPVASMPFCRSWAFNIGVQHARSDLMVLHDNDMPIPQDYGVWIAERVARGYEVVNPKRFIFYLSEKDTEDVFAGTAIFNNIRFDAIVQNLEAGGSVAITRAAYERIGGMDESFVGWGGEDNEFWERAQTLCVWPWGGLPLLHLWHLAQPGKHDSTFETAKNYKRLGEIPPIDRILALNRSRRGQTEGPTSWLVTQRSYSD